MVDAPPRGSRPLRTVTLVVIALVALFAVVQLLPVGRIENPPVKREPPWDSPATRQLAVAACFDCHSNQTRHVWYEKVVPVSLWIKNHVDNGRRSLNFSEFDPNRHRSGQRIAETITEGRMPPSYYTWFGLHSTARLTAAQRDQLIRGLTATYGPAVGLPNRGREGGGERR